MSVTSFHKELFIFKIPMKKNTVGADIIWAISVRVLAYTLNFCALMAARYN